MLRTSFCSELRFCLNFNEAHKQNVDTRHAIWDTECSVYKEALLQIKYFGYTIATSISVEYVLATFGQFCYY